MNPGFRKRLLAGAVASMLITGAAQAAEIEGRVVDEDSDVALSGVRVRVADGSAEAYTDRSGRFVLRDVDPGTVTLVFDYVGLESRREQVNLSDDRTAVVNVSLASAAVLDTIVVTAQRQAQNRALNRYRSADSISSFIASDDMGQFVDQNVAESLQRLPGVSITRDQGEGRFANVRGIDAGLSTVSINGMRIGTPEDSSRAVPLDVIPAGSVEMLEVTKVPTPDMPGDAIGGAVEISSGSPFDRSGQELRYRLEGSYNQLSGDYSPKAQVNYDTVTGLFGGAENLGISAGLNYQDRSLQSDNIEAEYDFLDLGADEAFSIIEVQQRKYYVERERLGANLNLEFRPDDASRYHANLVYSEFTDAETRQRSIMVFEDGDLTSFDGRNAVYEGIEEDGFRRRIRSRTKEQDTLAFAAGGEHMLGGWTLDYNVGISTTRERVPDETEGRFEKTGDPLGANVTTGGIPSFTILDGGSADSSYLQHDNYALDRVVLEPIAVDDDDINGELNIEVPGAFGMASLTLKTGLDFRFKDKDSDVDEIELRDVPDVSLAPFTSGAPDYPFGNLGQGISSPLFLSYFADNRDQFGIRPKDEQEVTELTLAEDYRTEEDVTAAYLMGTWDLDQWQVIAGVRAERTDYSSVGNELSFNEDGTLGVSERRVSSDYDNLLPALHLRYEPMDSMVLRAAWSNTISRPSFGDISPRSSIDRDDREIDIGNPDLDPYESTNYDLMLDWYPGNAGVVSLGVFHKDIDNYIVEFRSLQDAEFPGFDVTRPVNGTEASVTGIEFNVQQGLEVLDERLAGLLVGFSLTELDTDLKLAERAGESFSLPSAAESAGNAYIGYERGNFSGRLSVSHRDEFLDEVGDDRNFDLYVAPHTQVDVTASYRITDAFELVTELTNLTDEALELYQGAPANVLQFEEYGPTFAIGFRGSF